MIWPLMMYVGVEMTAVVEGAADLIEECFAFGGRAVDLLDLLPVDVVVLAEILEDASNEAALPIVS